MGPVLADMAGCLTVLEWVWFAMFKENEENDQDERGSSWVWLKGRGRLWVRYF